MPVSGIPFVFSTLSLKYEHVYKAIYSTTVLQVLTL